MEILTSSKEILLREIVRRELNELFGKKQPKGDAKKLYRFIKDKVNQWAMMKQDMTDDEEERDAFLRELIDSVEEAFPPISVPQFSQDDIEDVIVKAFKTANL